MIFLKKPLIISSFLLVITFASAQNVAITLKTNPLLELGINTKILGLKGNVKEMQEHKFTTDAQGKITNDSALVSNQYKFNQNGLTQEIEETIRNSQSKNSFFSYTNKEFISHIDIETIPFVKDKDSTENTSEQDPIFSTVDYRYVQKKNILYKGEDYKHNLPQKVTTQKEYFYHFNDANQIFQIDYKTSDSKIQYNYDINGLIKQSLSSKSGIATYKNIYRYDRNNRIINIATFNSGNTTKYPNEETVITYKLDSNGNTIEEKVKSYLYSPQGTKNFKEGYLYLYNYTYL